MECLCNDVKKEEHVPIYIGQRSYRGHDGIYRGYNGPTAIFWKEERWLQICFPTCPMLLKTQSLI
jgi:hypothetical protein